MNYHKVYRNYTANIILFSLIIALIVGVGLPILLLLVSGNLIYRNPPTRTIPENVTHERYTIQANNRVLDIIKMPNTASENTILYFHGNGGFSLQIAQKLQAFGTVFSSPYPGYEQSTGNPKTTSINENAETLFNHVIEKGVKPEKLIVFGHSLGGSPATYLASKHNNISKLLLVNTFYSVKSMCELTFGYFCVFGNNLHPTHEYARDITIPVYQFHVLNDETIPYEQGVKLSKEFTKATHSFYEISGTHNQFDIENMFQKQ
jgi:uncharacterized protein